jgi:hypothetical protein
MYSVVLLSANLKFFCLTASTSDGLQVEAAFLMGDSG